MQLSWRKGTKYYKLLLHRNFFGTTDIVCYWGQLGNKLGNYKIIRTDNEEEVECNIAKIRKRRQYRGYELCIAQSPVGLQTLRLTQETNGRMKKTNDLKHTKK